MYVHRQPTPIAFLYGKVCLELRDGSRVCDHNLPTNLILRSNGKVAEFSRHSAPSRVCGRAACTGNRNYYTEDTAPL